MKPPAFLETAFNCPHCKAFAQQKWSWAVGDGIYPHILAQSTEYLRNEQKRVRDPVFTTRDRSAGYEPIDSIFFSCCSHCYRIALWHGDRLILPKIRTAPFANPDMPDEVATDYEEAALIVGDSPRGAAALLRLALQKLCKHLGEPGKHIDTDIKSLVAKGLNVRVQQALDAVRVIGNESVHPGKLDLQDDRETATMLFSLLNLIVEKMISEPNQVQAIYDMLPEGKRKGIEQRDS